MRKTIIFFTLFSALLVGKLCAQSLTYLVRFKDKLSDKPIENALITIKDSVVTTSNYLGYSQFQALVGDTVMIKHSDYKPVFIILNTESKVSISLVIDPKKLIYTNGMSSFYYSLQKLIKYPKILRTNGIQTKIYVELKVDSFGGTEVVKVHNDYEGVFFKELTKNFKKMNGKWDLSYENKIFILPITYKMNQTPRKTQDKRLIAKYDVMLSEVVVTGYSLLTH